MVKLNEREIGLFNALSGSQEAEIWRGYFDKLVAEVADVRNLDKSNLEVEAKASERIIKLIEENLISRIKIKSNESSITEPNHEHE